MLFPQRETASFTPRLSYSIPGLDRPLGFQGFVIPKIYRQSAHEGGEVIPMLRPPSLAGVTFSTHFCETLSRLQDHSAAGRFKLTLNLLTTTIVVHPSNVSKWQMGFNSAFKG
jgi:hypothetical protein